MSGYKTTVRGTALFATSVTTGGIGIVGSVTNVPMVNLFLVKDVEGSPSRTIS